MQAHEQEIQFHISGLAEWKRTFLQKLFKQSDQYALVLERADNPAERITMMIGQLEAQELALAIEKLPTARPTISQLFCTTITTLGFTPSKVVLDRLDDKGVFCATIYLSNGKETKAIDSRPADAFTLAVNAGCRIFVIDGVAR